MGDTCGEEGPLADGGSVSADGGGDDLLAAVRLPSGWALVGALCLAFAAAALILLLASAELSRPSQFTHAGRVLDDGIIAFDELPVERTGIAPDPSLAAAAERRNDCDVAVDNYVAVAETELRASTPSRIRVPNYTDPDAEGRTTCTVIEERRLAETGTSVLIVAVLGAFSALVAAAAWPGARRAGRTTHTMPAVALTVVMIGVTLGLSGQYADDWHFIAALVFVAGAILLLFRSLMDTSTAAVDPQQKFSRALDEVQVLRHRTRFALGGLSIILSLSVALAAAMNARYLATEGAMGVSLPGIDLGGFGPDDLGLITAIEGILYASVLAAVALPALYNTERQGRRILERGLQTDPEVGVVPADRVDAVVRREEVAAKLGLRTRPTEWLERATALLLPLLTGASADFLGILG